MAKYQPSRAVEVLRFVEAIRKHLLGGGTITAQSIYDPDLIEGEINPSELPPETDPGSIYDPDPGDGPP